MPSKRPWGRIRCFPGETPALVGIVNRKKDWRLLVEQHWYRIPVKSAPGDLEDAKYLAWYHTAAFEDDRWSVRWYARIRSVTSVRRVDLLPDEPGHSRAQEPYYRVDVGDILRLPNPVPSARWRRIVFIPTSLERLLVAREVNDLFRGTAIEDRLYFEMRDAGLAAERQFLVRESGRGYMLDMALFCRDGGLDVECDGERWHSGRDAAERDRGRDNALTSAGWRILRFSGSEIVERPRDCLRTVSRTVRRLGGAQPPGSG